MEKKMTTEEYFRLSESLNPMELVWGCVHEPPAPRFGHQSVVSRLHLLLKLHVEERRLGEVCASPLDVVLDNDAALVVQPDIIFVSNERRGIIGERIWGAPDLVVEVLSPSTAYRDRTLKLAWYGRYGVRECWLVDPKEQRVEVVDLQNDSHQSLITRGDPCTPLTNLAPLAGPQRPAPLRSFSGKTPIVSRVLPEFAVAAERCFE